MREKETIITADHNMQFDPNDSFYVFGLDDIGDLKFAYGYFEALNDSANITDLIKRKHKLLERLKEEFWARKDVEEYGTTN